MIFSPLCNLWKPLARKTKVMVAASKRAISRRHPAHGGGIAPMMRQYELVDRVSGYEPPSQ